MAESYILKSNIKKLAKSLNLRISANAIIIVNSRVEEILKKAAKRARENNRKTIKSQDI